MPKVFTTAKSQRVNCKAPILFAHKNHNELIVLRAYWGPYPLFMAMIWIGHFYTIDCILKMPKLSSLLNVTKDSMKWTIEYTDFSWIFQNIFSNKILILVYLLLRISFRLDFYMINSNLMFTTFRVSYSKYQMSEQRFDKLSEIYI